MSTAMDQKPGAVASPIEPLPDASKHLSTPAPYSLSQRTNSLGSELSAPDLPPKIQVIKSEDYTRMPWKNGVGETIEIAIHPSNRNFRKDAFIWRLSLSEVRDSCSFSLFPGYDIWLFMLPESAASVPLRGNLSAPAFLHHNDHVTPIAIKPLVPYTYRGEWPTTCTMNVSPLKHLTFIANRRLAKVSMSLETICENAIGDDGVCDTDASEIDDVALGVADDTSQPTEPTAQLEANAADPKATTDHATKQSLSSSSSYSKLLLGNFTILYVVSGSIRVTVEGDSQPRIVHQGQTLLCERDDECAPTDLKMTPIIHAQHAASANSTKSAVQREGLCIDGSSIATSTKADGELKANHDATVLIIHVHLVPTDRQGSYILDSPTTNPTPAQAPGTALPPMPAAVASVTQSQTASQPQSSVAQHPQRLRGRAGSIIVYDDQPMWTLPKEMERQMTLSDVGSPPLGPNLTTKYWESAHHYRPPLFSSRYQNESEVPPPIVRDSLVIEEFPQGKISTAWINMVKQGLSEWIRVPVIIARGTEPGPVVGITAVVHGNELNGVPCIHRVITDIDVRKLKGTVVAVPCVNVPGYLRFTREFSDGRDLNRLFPGQEHGTASQVYNHNLVVKIINHFNYLIDLHTASFGRVNSYYVRADMNDPVSAMLAKLQQPQIILHNSGQDGTLRSAASARGVKSITVEIGNPQLLQNQFVQWSYLGVMRILAYLNMFTAEEEEPTTPQPNTILCSKGFWIYTNTGGVLEVYPAVNSIIRKGDLIARIKNIFGNIVDEIYAPSHGVTIGRSSNPVAMAGDRVMHMGVIKKENEVLPKEAKENY
ncbi:hypothetical protein BC831DRAFT_475199 [Entophlyctis helioformis]|nr:hypothetical protein BC831DRAFT_475199 [Entophlyctis helioformis]